MPKRLDPTFQTWDDEEEIDAFVDADDINYKGRDLIFYGFIDQERNEAVLSVEELKTEIKSFTDLVPFETDFGTFQVKVTSIDVAQNNYITTFIMKMREPVVDLTGGTLPSAGSGSYTIDNISLFNFGVFVSKITGKLNLPEMNNETFVVYEKEGYQVTNRKANEFTIDGAVIGSSNSDFQDKIKALYLIFSSPELRQMRLLDYLGIEGFNIDGFQVTNVRLNNEFSAIIKIKMISVREYFRLIVTEEDKAFATEDLKLILY